MQLIFVVTVKGLTFPVICYFLQPIVEFFTCFNKLGFVWPEAWENGAMSCSLSVMTNYLMGLDSINEHSEVNHRQVN